MRQCLTLLLIIISLHPLYGEKPDEYTVKGIFIGKFTEFIAWPKEISETRKQFTITILGKNPFKKKLEKIYRKHKIKGVDVSIQYIQEKEFKELKESDILFLKGVSKETHQRVINAFQGRPVLLIGDTPGYCLKGIHINFFLKRDQIRFEINPDNFKKSRLRIHYRLLQLAKIVVERQ